MPLISREWEEECASKLVGCKSLTGFSGEDRSLLAPHSPSSQKWSSSAAPAPSRRGEDLPFPYQRLFPHPSGCEVPLTAMDSLHQPYPGMPTSPLSPMVSRSYPGSSLRVHVRTRCCPQHITARVFFQPLWHNKISKPFALPNALSATRDSWSEWSKPQPAL